MTDDGDGVGDGFVGYDGMGWDGDTPASAELLLLGGPLFSSTISFKTVRNYAESEFYQKVIPRVPRASVLYRKTYILIPCFWAVSLFLGH
jgi:hypothetical protein